MLLVAGHPWGVTWAFSLWAAKIAVLFGWNPASSAFWSAPFQSHALQHPLFEDTISILNLGILLGAFVAAALAGKLRPKLAIPLPSLAAAVIGGLVMGYGTRLAYGCNIGAFFSGVASTSLHGLVVAGCCNNRQFFRYQITPKLWFRWLSLGSPSPKVRR